MPFAATIAPGKSELNPPLAVMPVGAVPETEAARVDPAGAMVVTAVAMPEARVTADSRTDAKPATVSSRVAHVWATPRSVRNAKP